MFDLVLAYRPNGCVVGCMTQFDFANVEAEDVGLGIDAARAAVAFGHLAAPPQGQINVRPIIIARATAVPDEVAQDSVDLIHNVGGADSGFRVAELLREYSDFDPQRTPLEVIIDRPPPVKDRPYRDADGSLKCPVCGEINCGWLAQDMRQGNAG